MSSASDLTRVRAFYERGEFFLNQGTYPDAATNYKDALKIMPEFLPARTHLAVALAKQKKYLDAIKLLEDARKTLPLRNDQLIEVLSLLGSICLVRQDYPAAIYYLKAARKIDANDAQLRLLMASCYTKAGKYDEALDLILESAQKHKD